MNRASYSYLVTPSLLIHSSVCVEEVCMLYYHSILGKHYCSQKGIYKDIYCNTIIIHHYGADYRHGTSVQQDVIQHLKAGTTLKRGFIIIIIIISSSSSSSSSIYSEITEIYE